MNANAALLKLGIVYWPRPNGNETKLHCCFQYGEPRLLIFSNLALVVKAVTEKMKSNIIKPAKYITHFKFPLLKLEIIKNPDNRTGDKAESICKIPPIDMDTPGSKLDNIAALTNFAYADSCG